MLPLNYLTVFLMGHLKLIETLELVICAYKRISQSRGFSPTVQCPIVIIVWPQTKRRRTVCFYIQRKLATIKFSGSFLMGHLMLY